jgi:hypothetical protein
MISLFKQAKRRAIYFDGEVDGKYKKYEHIY